MGSVRRTIFGTLVLLIWSAAAAAQPAPETRVDPPRWDITGIVGSFTGYAGLPDDPSYADDWFNVGQVSGVVGLYWSRHFKTEVTFTRTAEGEQYVQRLLTVPTSQYTVPYYQQQFTSAREFTATAVWQFNENAWVHPFVEAGVAIDVERQRLFTPGRTYTIGDPRVPGGTAVVFIDERQEGPITTTIARGLIGAGAKLYLTPRLFFRSDGRAAIGSRIDHISLRIGFGVDF